MTGKVPTTAPAAAPAAAATTNPNDPAALLLSILRNVDREVRGTLELGEEALKAIKQFRAIDAILRVRPVADSGFATGTANGTGSGAGTGFPPRTGGVAVPATAGAAANTTTAR